MGVRLLSIDYRQDGWLEGVAFELARSDIFDLGPIGIKYRSIQKSLS